MFYQSIPSIICFRSCIFGSVHALKTILLLMVECTWIMVTWRHCCSCRRHQKAMTGSFLILSDIVNFGIHGDRLPSGWITHSLAEWYLEGITGNVNAIRLLNSQAVGTQNGIQFRDCWQFDKDLVTLEFDGESQDVQFGFADLLTRCQVEGLFVERTGHLGHVSGVAHDALRQYKGLLVRTHVLCAVPFSPHRIVEYCQLRVPVQDGGTDVGQKVRRRSDFDPRFFGLGEDVIAWCLPVGLRLSILWPIRWSDLSTHVNEFDHIVLLDILVGVGELFECCTELWIFNNLRLFISGTKETKKEKVQDVSK